ncbi:MAG TPA: ABC transporter permease [Candidatus Dormibacteraeota bacterium]|nr:ABC transporter permease [Candidatus Dormibacteraeota bacterium]
MAWRELKLAGRTLRKSPVFTIAAALTIALGIGASTAIFSVANAVLLRPIPYKDPGRLVIASGDMTVRHVHDFPFSNEDFIDLRDATKDVFAGMAGVFTFRNILQKADGTPEQVRTAVVTTNFFGLLGAKIALGRDFNDGDGLPQPAPPAGGPAAAPAGAPPPPPPLPVMTILSYEYFQRRYGGDPNVIGQMLVTNGPFRPQIVGVLAPGFALYFPPSVNEEAKPEVWFANRLNYDNKNRNAVSIRAIARLKGGVTIDRAQSAADNVAAEARKNFLIERTAGYAIRIEELRQHTVAEVRPAILALMGAVIFLLLIACANVANLLLVRASLRERELSVRAALGATWWSLARQMLTESLLLAAIGSAVGLLLAWLGIFELRLIAPASLPRVETVRIDGVVLGFTALAGLAAAVVFGVASAWRAARPNVMNVLRGASRNEGLASGGLLRKSVVVTEVALSFLLLVGSGLMFRSFLELQRIDPGFDPKGLLTFQVLAGNQPNQKPEELAARMQQLQQRLRDIPGIQSVTAAFPFPLAGGFNPIRWGTEEALSDASKFQATDFQIVLPGYFEAMHTPLLAGRTFTEADNQPKRNVVLVDKLLADKAFPGQPAVGKRILIRIQTPEPQWVEIIGVVAHQREESLAEPGREQVYFTDAYLGSGVANQWAIRSAGDPAKFSSDIRSAIKAFNPQLLLTEFQPMDALVEKAQAGTRFSLLLIGVFAVVAALLAGVGLYGVLATIVRQRTAEIGVRMTLGARPRAIFRLIVGQGLRLTLVGIAAGLIAAFALTRAMTTMLVGVKPTDPATYASMALLFLFIAATASWLPAQRAAGLDPTRALRDE